MQATAGREMAVGGELEEEDAPRLVMPQCLYLPRLAIDQPTLQAVRPQFVSGPIEGDVFDALDVVRNTPFQGAGEQLPDEAILVGDAGDGAFDVRRAGHQFNSIQHFSTGFTPI